MNLSGYEFQVIFCALILLGLASVALIVDYLKGMNEKLRERHIELMARHETVVQRVEEDNTRLLRALAEQSKSFREMTKRSMQANRVSTEAPMPEITLPPVPEESAAKAVSAPEIQESVISSTGPVALADPEPAPLPQADSEASQDEELPSNVIRIRLKSAQPEPVPSSEPDFDKFMEDLVTEFKESPDQEGPSTSSLEALAQRIDEFEPRLEIPVGTHHPAVLNQLLTRTEPFTGLLLSIGINDYMKLGEIHGLTASEELLNSVDSLMSDLVGNSAFCTRRSDDEFCLIFSGLTGVAAQQKVTSISEQLWDYQLQTLGTFAVVFSWGASALEQRPLRDALLMATENMMETKDSRKAMPLDPNSKERATA